MKQASVLHKMYQCECYLDEGEYSLSLFEGEEQLLTYFALREVWLTSCFDWIRLNKTSKYLVDSKVLDDH